MTMVQVQSRSTLSSRRHPFSWLDPMAFLVIGLLAGLWAFFSGAQIAAWITDYRYLDLWFQGDSPRAFANMTNMLENRWSRDDLHPLFRVVTYPLTAAIAGILGLSPLEAVRVVISTVAALWAAGFYGVLRVMRLGRLEALMFSLVLISSSAFIFWAGLPETFPFGSLSLILSLGLVAAAEWRRVHPGLFVVNNLLTVGFVPTSALAGMAATLLQHTWKKSLGILAVSAGALFGLWQVHKAFFPVDHASSQDLFLDQAGGPLQILGSLFGHTLVMPEIKLILTGDSTPDYIWRMTTQFSVPGSGGVLAAIALAAGLGMLALGAWSALTMRGLVKLRWLLAIVGLGFVGAHVIFGDETFLYSLQFAPLLVLLAAFSAMGPMRRWGMALAVLFVFSAGTHNVTQFQRASAYVQAHQSSKHPIFVWPQGATYVNLVYRPSLELNRTLTPPLAPSMRRERILPFNYRIRSTVGDFKRRVQGRPGNLP